MSAKLLNDVRRGFYLDSVALMQLSRDIEALPGVERSRVDDGLAVESAILRTPDCSDADARAQPNDLVIAFAAEARRPGGPRSTPPRTALDEPKHRRGESAGGRARIAAGASKRCPGPTSRSSRCRAISPRRKRGRRCSRGLHVMMFSDNVTLEDEVALKQRGARRWPPDDGPRLRHRHHRRRAAGLRQRVHRGEIGIVGASGTGTQEVSSLISRGRRGYLARDRRGRARPQARDRRYHDADGHRGARPRSRNAHIVLISKPPHPEVARACSRGSGGARRFHRLLHRRGAIDLPANAGFAPTLRGGRRRMRWRRAMPPGSESRAALPRGQGAIEGLFSGGTLCAEAQVILLGAGRGRLQRGHSRRQPTDAGAAGATADRSRRRRIHARPAASDDRSGGRDEELRAALADPGVASILLDVVIGYGAHADPAGHLAGVVAGRRGRTRRAIVAS